MPYKLELTWVSHARKWKKKYQGKQYYLKTKCSGKNDREGYLQALREWQRLKAWIDGFGPSPYTPTGVLIPEHLLQGIPAPNLTYVPVQLPEPVRNPIGWSFQPHETGETPQPPAPPESIKTENPPISCPPWMETPGVMGFLHPHLIASAPYANPSEGERRISALVQQYADRRKVRAEQGKLSLKQLAEDQRQLETFTNWLKVNYPQVVKVDSITAPILNHYRDHQETACTSDVTLRKRLQTVRKWFLWLLDDSILSQPPRDLTTYGRIEISLEKPTFFTTEEIRVIFEASPPLLQCSILLGLNCGLTQIDCSTLRPEHIDLAGAMLHRERNKTGVEQRAKLWPRTLELLQRVGDFSKPDSPLLKTPAGKPLVIERLTSKGKISKVDYIHYLHSPIAKQAGIDKSFKHYRKTSANEIEKLDASLTPLFLSHADRRTARHYVTQHYEKLFELTDQLEALLFHSNLLNSEK